MVINTKELSNQVKHSLKSKNNTQKSARWNTIEATFSSWILFISFAILSIRATFELNPFVILHAFPHGFVIVLLKFSIFFHTLRMQRQREFSIE